MVAYAERTWRLGLKTRFHSPIWERGTRLIGAPNFSLLAAPELLRGPEAQHAAPGNHLPARFGRLLLTSGCSSS